VHHVGRRLDEEVVNKASVAADGLCSNSAATPLDIVSFDVRDQSL